MHTNIQKWGNSLGMRIPQHIVEEFSLHSGSPVEIYAQDDHIVISPKKYNLAEMLSTITEENKPELEWDDDEQLGKEIL